MLNDKITKVLVVPSYKEYEGLPVFLKELFEKLDSDMQVLVADDSPQEEWENVKRACEFAVGSKSSQLSFSFASSRTGRGGAVRRAFQMALIEFPHATRFLECDSDGSHRPIDVLKIARTETTTNVVIGSRYLKESKIVGWPISRRIFSRILNFVIPRLWGFRISDITNGLRSYDITSLRAILAEEQKNVGFIYLTEQMIHLKGADLEIREVPICFINRTIGESTLGFSEVLNSLIGLASLFFFRKSGG
jgi:dolichol-phosphate mannosyltransferase